MNEDAYISRRAPGILLLAALALLASPFALAQPMPAEDAPGKLNLKLQPQAIGPRLEAGAHEDSGSQASAPSPVSEAEKKRQALDKIFAGSGTWQDHAYFRSSSGPADLTAPPDCPTPKMVAERAADKKKHYNYPNCPSWRLPAEAR
ncbi:hypothetical protein [Dyella sp. 2RAB6]|uniref:hypothetical protein n=1 Tax=Dyella sp. 2RAB6 TaxID=3232992 RepID=UPI003F92F794